MVAISINNLTKVAVLSPAPSFYFCCYLIITPSPCLSSHSFILVFYSVSSLLSHSLSELPTDRNVHLGKESGSDLCSSVSNPPFSFFSFSHTCPFYLLVTHKSYGDGHKHTCTLTCMNSHPQTRPCTVSF